MSEYHFDDSIAKQYDQSIVRSIPGYKVMHELVQSIAKRALDNSSRVLSVGSGTGNELIDLTKKLKQGAFVGVDTSPAMCSMAKNRIEAAGLQSRIELICGEVTDLPFGKFDLAMALLVMHFIPDDGSKKKFLTDIAACLNDGGIYIHADLVGQRGSDAFQQNLVAWHDFQLAHETPPNEVQDFFANRFPKVNVVTESRVIELLNESGFLVENIFFKALMVTGIVCRKNKSNLK
jgi:tRNA (cmo5U34)-methyltransferase